MGVQILLIPSLCAECDPHIHTQFGSSLNDLLFSKGSWSFVRKMTYLPSSNFVFSHQCPSSAQTKLITTYQQRLRTSLNCLVYNPMLSAFTVGTLGISRIKGS